MKLDNLTTRQIELLDLMWSISSLNQLNEWIDSLSLEDAEMAVTLSTMLIYENVDEILESSQDFTQAKQILSQF